MNKFLIFLITITLSFFLGMYLAAANHSAKAMDYNVGQAVALLAMPDEQHQPGPTIPEPEAISLGQYTVTAYCPCEVCCGKWSNQSDPKTASGTTPAEGITVGTDWDKLPKGTSLYIEGVGERIVEDKTAGWINERYGGKVIDLFYYSHEDALDFGKQELDVWEVR